ncbi:MAG: hypothetical protein QXI86_01240 [Ignisphaera sp.]
MSLDPILFVFIGYNLEVSGTYMGLLSAIWSIVYVLISKALNRVADEGYNKFLLLFSFGFAGISYLCFRSLNHVTALLSYTMHAASVASMNLAISVTMLENIDSDLWQTSSILQRCLSSLARGVVLIVMAFEGVLSIHNLFYVSLILAIISLILTPSISITFERRFYRLSRSLNELGMYIKASSSILFLDKPNIAQYIFTYSWNKWSTIPSYKILISTAMTTALGEYVFTVLPIILRRYMVLNNMWMAYGIAAIFSAITIAILKDLSTNRRGFAMLLIAIRTCVLVLGLSIIKDLVSLTIYIVLSSLLYMLIDITLYNMFIEVSAGFSTANYFISREMGSILGSLIGGIMIAFGDTSFLAIATVIGSLAALILI